MALNNFTTDLNNHQSQPDRPTLSASDLKILFDKAANDTQDFINDEMVANIYDKGEVDTAIANAEIDPTTQKATQAQAETGTDNDTWMTPLRVKQSIDANVPETLIRTNNYETTGSSVVNVALGYLELDGTSGYATLPASVGQLTNGSDTFELTIKTQQPNGQGTLISKLDTSYSATANVKGWHLYISAAGAIILAGSGTNGVAQTLVNTGSSTIPSSGDVWIKITFNGTQVEILSSTDGISFISEATSTDANLINGLSTSDIVDTQLGRAWYGSSGYLNIFDGKIYSVELSKISTPTNEYLFQDVSTPTTIVDTVGTDNGTIFSPATQSTQSIAFTLSNQGITSYTDDDRYLFKADRDSGNQYIQGGSLILNGTDEFEISQSETGQFNTNDEFIIKFNADDVTSVRTLIGKSDTTYSATTTVFGWRLFILSGTLRLIGYPSNGGTQGALSGSTVLSTLTDYWVKITYNGTQAELLLSTDGVIFSSEGTSTNANLINGMLISDNVDTQIGRYWEGSDGFNDYFDGTIDSITKNGTQIDYFKTLTTPTLNIDELGTKDIKGVTTILADNFYEGVYDSSDDTIKVADSVQNVSQEWEEIDKTIISVAGLYSLTGIDTKYNNLKLEVQGAITTATNDLFLRFNGDSGSNYESNSIGITATTIADNQDTAATWARIQNAVSYETNYANTLGNAIIYITNISGNNHIINYKASGAGSSATNVSSASGTAYWNSTAKITQIDTALYNLKAGSIIRVYGKE